MTGRKLSYGDLYTQVFRIASALRQMGVRQGDVVMILAPNCLEYPPFYLAAGLMGAVISTANPAYTEGMALYLYNHIHDTYTHYVSHFFYIDPYINISPENRILFGRIFKYSS